MQNIFRKVHDTFLTKQNLMDIKTPTELVFFLRSKPHPLPLLNKINYLIQHMQSKDANRISKLLAKKQNLQENQIKILNGFHITEKSLTNSLYEWILETTHACMTEKILLSQNLTLKKRGTKVSLINLRTGTHYSQKSITYHQRVKQTSFLLFAIKI